MNKNITIKNTAKKGRGVYALKNFKKGEIIEICPIIYLSAKDRKKIDQTALAYYIYPWKTTRCASMVLGYGSIYNHSYNSNAEWDLDHDKLNMVYKAVTAIKRHEEITVNYNGASDDKKPIDWFDVN